MSNDVDTDVAAAADMYNDVDHNVGAYMDATWTRMPPVRSHL